jgi:hypothetical protein
MTAVLAMRYAGIPEKVANHSTMKTRFQRMLEDVKKQLMHRDALRE